MAADFPDNPNVNDTFTVGDRTWIWNGTTWDAAVEEVLSADAPITFDSSTRTVGLDQAGVQDGRNYIINGAFDIWQRGTSGFGDSSYTADRWRVFYGTGGTAAVTQQSFSPADIEAIGFGDAKYFLRFDQTVAPSSGNSNIVTRIEDIRTLAGQTVTLSFYAKAETARDITVQSVYFPDGSASGSELFETVAIGTTWQRYSVTFSRTSTSGMTIGSNSYVEIRFRNVQQIAEYFDLWGVQLEAGSIATPFKRNANSIQGELAACQRYYIRDNADNSFTVFATAYAANATTIRGSYRFLSTMRVTPTISSGGNFQVEGIDGGPVTMQFARANRNGCDLNISSTNNTPGYAGALRASNDSSAYIEMDAEL